MRLTKRLWESQSRVLYRTIASSFADASAFFGTGNNLRDRHRVFPDIPRHAVGGGSVKIIFRKEFFRHGGGQYLSVKEKGASVCVFGGKFHIVSDRENRQAVIFKINQNFLQFFL